MNLINLLLLKVNEVHTYMTTRHDMVEFGFLLWHVAMHMVCHESETHHNPNNST